MTCLLCGSADVSVLERLLTDDVVAGWREVMRIDIKAELPAGGSLSRIACHVCRLEYYEPAAAGSERMYRDLQEQHWYYLADKWEYGTALQDIKTGSRVLEIGCGQGAFVAMARAHRHADANGLELNASAVAEAQRLKRPVALGDVQTAAGREPASYDVLCHFQVLEHVAEPRPFLDACVRLLKPGGRLCLAVPNNDGYAGGVPGALLNQPPHHVSRWGEATLRHLPDLFPVRLDRLVFEPLHAMHIGDYLKSRIAGWTRQGQSRIRRGVARRAMFAALRVPTVRRHVRGHTLYASFTRLAR